MSLKVKTSVDGSGFARGLEKMEHDAANFGKNLSSKISGNFGQAVMGIVPGLTSAIAGVFAADSVKSALSDFAQRGKDIKLGALRLNVDPETFERIDNVMKAVGQDAGGVESAFDHLAEGLTKIEQGDAGSDKLRIAFAQLGIGADEIARRDVPQMFFKIAESLKGVAPSKEQIAALREIYGKSGDNLLPALQVGFTGRTASTGLLTGDQMQSIATYNYEMREAKRTGAGAVNWLKAQGLDIVAGAVATWRQVTEAVGMASGLADTGPTSEQEEIKDQMTRRATAFAAQKALQEAQHANMRAMRDKKDKEDSAGASAIDKETNALRERNRLAAMTPEEKRLELLKQIAQLEGELRYGGGDLTKTDKAKMRQSIEEKHGQLGELIRAHEHHSLFNHPHLLGNTSVGGIMLGRGGDPAKELHTEMKKATAHLEKIDANTARANAGRAKGNDLP